MRSLENGSPESGGGAPDRRGKGRKGPDLPGRGCNSIGARILMYLLVYELPLSALPLFGSLYQAQDLDEGAQNIIRTSFTPTDRANWSPRRIFKTRNRGRAPARRPQTPAAPSMNRAHAELYVSGAAAVVAMPFWKTPVIAADIHAQGLHRSHLVQGHRCGTALSHTGAGIELIVLISEPPIERSNARTRRVVELEHFPNGAFTPVGRMWRAFRCLVGHSGMVGSEAVPLARPGTEPEMQIAKDDGGPSFAYFATTPGEVR